MEYPASPYIEERFGGLYLAGTGVSLDSVVINFQGGSSPEKIVEAFSTLKLSEVYGAIAYYLENEQTIKDYLERQAERVRSMPRLSQTNPELVARLEAAREKMGLKRG